MIQYNTIQDAITALIQTYGPEVLENTARFIALLSDYAPDFPVEQKRIRSFARAGGFSQMVAAIRHHDEFPAVLAMICEKAVKAESAWITRRTIVSEAKQIVIALNGQYTNGCNVSAIYEEGMKYYRRFPKEKNIPVAILLLEEAAELGSSEALLYISRSYLKGKGIEKNTDQGMNYLQRAAEMGNVRACIELAECLWKGTNAEKNVSGAVDILMRLDDPQASFMLGKLFCETEDYRKAFEHYQIAAKSDNVYAQYEVAVSYATGRGTERNIKEAKKWLRSAASLGHSEARRKLEELGEKWD